MITNESRPHNPEVTDGGQITEHQQNGTNKDSLTLVDTGAGSLVFQVLREPRNGKHAVVGKQLLGFLDVEDWDAIRDAVTARGHGPGDVLHLPEFDTLEEAHAAADDGGQP